MVETIVSLGFSQLDEGGTDAINLRAVARDLGVVSSAIYRYVRNRDEFLTLLIDDAYRQLADYVVRDSASSFAALASAMRQWALAHPRRWALIYGSPIAGYTAPKRTVVEGTRVLRIVISFLGAASDADTKHPGPLLERDLVAIQREWAPELDLAVIELALEGWTQLIGLISAEVFGQLGKGALTASDEFFDRSVERLTARLGLQS